MASKKSPSATDEVLKDPEVRKDIKTLTEAGCDPNELLVALGLVFRAKDSWKELVGTDLRTYRRNIREVEHCASLIERLNGSDLLYRLSIEYCDHNFAAIHRSPTLPGQLREYAAKLGCLPELQGPRRNMNRHAWKAWLVAVVIEGTGKPHDSEVAALIAAVLDDPKYNGQAQQAWRRTHKGFYKGESQEKKLFRDWKEQRCLPGSPAHVM